MALSRRPAASSDSDELAYADPLPALQTVLFVGAGVACAGKGVQGFVSGAAPDGAVLMMLAVGAFVVGAAVLDALSGRRLVLDRRSRSILLATRRRSPRWTYERFVWDAFVGVTIAEKTITRGPKTYVSYAVRLAGTVPPLELMAFPTPQAARSCGESVARFMGLGLLDSTGPAEWRRGPGALGLSLPDRVREDLAAWDPGPSLGPMAVAVDARDGALTLGFPREPLRVRPFVLLALVSVGGMAGVLHLYPWLLPRLRERPASSGAGGVLVALLVLVGLVAVVRLLRALTLRVTVVADASSLRVVTRRLGWTTTKAIHATRLEDLLLERDGAGCRLAVVTRRQTLRFGRGVPDRELEWIRRTLVRVLAASGAGDRAASPPA
jgi:hypothetical protein